MNREFDVIIIGGGVAGLWTAGLLKARGYSVALFSRGELGEGQSLAAQGVIHGGSKYAIAGKLTDSSEELAAMPGRWRDALNGIGEIDLKGATKVLSDHQVLWSLPNVASQVVSFFGSKLMRGRADSIPRSEWPLALDRKQYKGKVFRIDEPVLDPQSVIDGLHRLVADHCYNADCEVVSRQAQIEKVIVEGHEIKATNYVFAAGSGNGALLRTAGIANPEMQLRPLHQVVIRGDLPDFYSVCIGTGPKPPIVTTTHTDSKGQKVWWIGGDIAESSGVARSEIEQIDFARNTMAELLPWFDWSHYTFETVRADRAEPLTGTGDRPPGAFCEKVGNVLVAWPTKLALAPDLADKIVKQLPEPRIEETGSLDLPAATVGRPPWF